MYVASGPQAIVFAILRVINVNIFFTTHFVYVFYTYCRCVIHIKLNTLRTQMLISPQLCESEKIMTFDTHAVVHTARTTLEKYEIILTIAYRLEKKNLNGKTYIVQIYSIRIFYRRRNRSKLKLTV